MNILLQYHTILWLRIIRMLESLLRQTQRAEVEAEDGLGSCKLGVSDNSGYLRVPLKGSIRVWSLRNLGVPYFGGPYNKDPTI